MEWENILPSTIIAAVITGIIELFRLNNNNKATYIIKQREKWREKIRAIADEIYGSDNNNIGIPLTKLKTRINAYGKAEIDGRKHELKNLEKYYITDAHIHETICKLEKQENFEENKKKLIYYLSLLLKFDWERSKREAKFNKTYVVSLILEVFGLVQLYFLTKEKNQLNLFLLSLLAFFYFLPKIIEILNETQTPREYKNSFVELYLPSNIGNALVFAIGCINENPNIVVSGVLLLLASLISIINAVSQKNAEKEYIEALEAFDGKIEKNFEKQRWEYLNEFLADLCTVVVILCKLPLSFIAICSPKRKKKHDSKSASYITQKTDKKQIKNKQIKNKQKKK
jgi:hypothetical protein